MANIYTDVPIASHTLADDQDPMRQNFAFITGTLGKDHQIGLNQSDATQFEGRHIQVCLNNRNGGPPPTVAGIGDGTDSLIYSDNGNLFFGSATGAGAFQLTTYNSGANFGGAAAIGGSTNAGWTFLPGGLILQYGTVGNDGGGNVAINFPIPFPSGSAPFSLQITRVHSSSSPGTNFGYWAQSGAGTTASKFTYINDDGHTWGFTWLAIGN